MFEGGDYAGAHTDTIRVDTPQETHHVDTGFIVFKDRNYPNFELLLRTLGVAWQPSVMSSRFVIGASSRGTNSATYSSPTSTSTSCPTCACWSKQ